MKSLILTAQEARELSSLGGLTVTKPIKPAPPYIEGAQFAEQLPGWVLVGPDARRLGAGDGVADLFAPPVTPGDAVYIREPWYSVKEGGDNPSPSVLHGRGLAFLRGLVRDRAGRLFRARSEVEL